MPLRLALFDCDGTIADSQRDIVDAMGAAFAACGLPTPPAPAIRATIGLSLRRIMATLHPTGSDAEQRALVDAYRDAYLTARTASDAQPEPLYDDIVAVMETLARSGWILGIATGKSQRGLLRLLDAHGIGDMFMTLQTSDFHPSKPDPAMTLAAMAECGTRAERCVVIGDTSYDMAMARSAGAHAVGVAWGYHPTAILDDAGAGAIAMHPRDLPDLLNTMVPLT
ncbi:MAG: HAD-IA family hydrolase [Sphingopyxis sp.]|jgi:phosphoglycolate phosphatase|nr:HAD-IA family hydrolase [Sphingopyxis sp.]